ncbi:hypothetical protein ALO65_200262 [Pseudomonas syringae pv. papulans]|nr:hypothetical protein ALO65_200262 [Pseudomonas syringae pv. papulans]
MQKLRVVDRQYPSGHPGLNQTGRKLCGSN